MRGSIKKFLGLALILCVKSQELKSCNLRDGSVGKCQHILECNSAKNEFEQGFRPILCGFVDRFPVVCCEENNLRNIEGRFPSRISDEKCEEYLKLDINTTILPTPKRLRRETVFPYVYGGMSAYGGEYPHMAILGYGSLENIQFGCGGSLISDQFVLTAAHCLESQVFGQVSLVRLGDLDLASSTDSAEPQDFQVQKVFDYHDYNLQSLYHDIALIKLDRPVVYTKYVKPACLQSTFELDNNNLILTGWGSLYYSGIFHNRLQTANLQNLPAKNCAKSFPPQSRLKNGFDEELLICGGNPASTVDACQGDSGGPLQMKIQDYPIMYRIVGVTAFGINCGVVAGVYTRVSNYINWIESIVWP